MVAADREAADTVVRQGAAEALDAATARVELAAAAEFDTTIVNDDVRRAAQELVSLMRSTPDGKQR